MEETQTADMVAGAEQLDSWAENRIYQQYQQITQDKTGQDMILPEGDS